MAGLTHDQTKIVIYAISPRGSRTTFELLAWTVGEALAQLREYKYRPLYLVRARLK